MADMSMLGLWEKLSRVVAETDGQVFRDEEFIAHLERLEAAEDDLSSEQG